ncbi:MAG: 50S ribosomal protein L3, partial [Gammaproteobacteria bacterium]|nr:50S ribosomal protein L3 [Gammaproteobacteria bacterium]
VVEILPNRVTQVRTKNVDGYDGIQVTTGERRPNRISKPMKGHFAKAAVEPGRGVWEFPLDQESEVSAGHELTVGLLKEGMKVDVSGRSIGKGFSGVMKRYGFGGGRASHGNSKAHRLAGSIGNAQDPGRVFKGKKMAGHQGDQNVVQQNLDIVKVDGERNIVLISGSIPGSRGSDVIVRPAVKSKERMNILSRISEMPDVADVTDPPDPVEPEAPVATEVQHQETFKADETGDERKNVDTGVPVHADAEDSEPAAAGDTDITHASEPVATESSERAEELEDPENSEGERNAD